jgi:carbamoyl-phosphate synthase large subunit
MLGKSLKELNCLKKPNMMHVSVKAPMFSFMRLRGADPILGVEMTSTGEVACLDYDFSGAYVKALIASNLTIPNPSKPVLITVNKSDRYDVYEIVQKLIRMGYPIYATRGTAETLDELGISDVKVFKKIHEDDGGEDIVEYLMNRKIGFVINTPVTSRKQSIDDGFIIRRTAIEFFVPVITRIETAKALVDSLEKNGFDSLARILPLNTLIRTSKLAKNV